MGATADKFFVQPGINPTSRQESLVSAAFYNAALIQHQDQIRPANGAQAMGYNEGGSSLKQQFERMLQTRLGDGVNGAGCLVQNQNKPNYQNQANGDYELTQRSAEPVSKSTVSVWAGDPIPNSP